MLNIKFTGEIWQWRGPAPFYFITVPEEHSSSIKNISNLVTYGWGVIPAYIRIGETEIKTSLFPKDGNYLVPVKVAVREAENLEDGSVVDVEVEIRF
jgi:hypothetical protein